MGTWGFSAFGPHGLLPWGEFSHVLVRAAQLWGSKSPCQWISGLLCQEVAKNLAMQLTDFHGALLARNTECVSGCELSFCFPCLSSPSVGMSLQGASLQSARGWRTWCPCETRYAVAGNPTFTYFPLRGEGKWKPSQPAAPWMPGIMLLPLHACPFPLSAVKALSLLLTEEAQRLHEIC